MKYKALFLTGALLLGSAGVLAFDMVKQQQNKGAFEEDVVLPSHLAQVAVDAVLAQELQTYEETFSKDLKEFGNIPADAPGKNTLIIRSRVLLDKPNLTSIMLEISRNIRGSAHPENHVASIVVLQNQKLSLPELLVDDNAFKALAQYCNDTLNQRNLSDKEWIARGSAATAENYRVFGIKNEGLLLQFGAYQVAPYAAGTPEITIPKALLKQWVKPAYYQLMWGASA